VIRVLAYLAMLPLCAWALLELLGGRSATRIALWLAAAVIVHDLVVLPLYSAADRVARSALRGAVNYVRIPAALSLLMLVVFLGHDRRGRRGRLPGDQRAGVRGYAARWLLATAALFAGSGLLYLVRRGSRSWTSPS
jgi:hypothetical protein